MSRGKRVFITSWRNGKGREWTIRIRWYESVNDADDIRLNMEDSQGERNIFPDDQEHAKRIWDAFKGYAPPAPDRTPFVANFIKLMLTPQGT